MGVAKKRRYDNGAREAAAQQTRERILVVTLELFRETHYDDITFARVAERAGVSPQTVTLHFRNKDGLVRAVRNWWRPQEEGLRETPGGDPLEAATKIVARYEDLGIASIRALAVEERVPALAELIEAGRRSHREWVERTFGGQLGRGPARERRLMALVATYDVYTWHVLRRVLSIEDTVITMAELARGVLAQPGSRR